MDSAIPRVLIIAGSDSSGGAGIQADLKTVSVLGAFGMTAVTALTAQNTTGVSAVVEMAPEFVAEQIDCCLNDIGTDAVKIGMLSGRAMIEMVAEKVREHRLHPLVVDPVILASSGARLLQSEALGALKTHLLPLATVLTPNLDEAEALSGRKVQNTSQMKQAARAIAELGVENVVIKGGHLQGAPVDVLFCGDRCTELTGERFKSSHSHGTGCAFASAIATFLAQGIGIAQSVAKAKEFISVAIQGGLAIGKGNGPANPMAWLEKRP